MLGLWLNPWSTDASGWSIADIWRYADLVGQAINLSLVFMLGYTVFVFIRFFRRYRLVRHEFCDLDSQSCRDSGRPARQLIADLSRGLETLRAIALTAPLLALAGTSYGILAFRRWGSNPSGGLSEQLLNAAVGILVAFPAIVIHNFVRIERNARRWAARRDRNDLGSFQIAQTLPLRKRFSGPPAFALIAAPALACALMGYMGLLPYPMPTGLRVHLLPIGTLGPRNGSTDKVTVSILSRRDALPIVRLNSEEFPLDNLEDAVRARLLPFTSCQAYVEADSAAYFTYVADVIDRMKRLHCQVVLLTTMPAPEVKRGSRQRAKIPIAPPAPMR